MSVTDQSAPTGGSYRALLRTPGVAVQAALGLVAQTTQLVVPVGIVLVVNESTGSLVHAGLAVAAFSVGAGLARPVQGRLIDRCGPRSVLLVTACLHAAAVIILTRAAAVDASSWVLMTLAWLAGVGVPPVSVAMRIDWARRTRPDLRTATYSLVYLVQELSFLVGPLLFSAIVAVLSASIALTVVAIAAAAGTLGLAWAIQAAPSRSAAAGGVGVIRNGQMRLLLAVLVLLGGAIGALEVGLPALAVAREVPAVGGLLLAIVSLGGIVGALCYGRLRWTARPARRLAILLLAMGVALIPAAHFGDLSTVGIPLFFAGIALNPALTTSSLVVDELDVAPAEAFGWLSTAFSVGAAASSSVAGVVGEHAGPARILLLAPVLALLGAALSLTLRAGRATSR